MQVDQACRADLGVRSNDVVLCDAAGHEESQRMINCRTQVHPQLKHQVGTHFAACNCILQHHRLEALQSADCVCAVSESLEGGQLLVNNRKALSAAS